MPNMTRTGARPMGAQAAATREALLDAFEAELTLTGWRETRVIEIARIAGTSPATFYQYFADFHEAYHALGARMEQQGRPRTAHMKLIDALLKHERAAAPKEIGAF